MRENNHDNRSKGRISIPAVGEDADGAAHSGLDRLHQARNAPAHPRPFRTLFPRTGWLTPRHTPPRQSRFRLRNRNRPLTQSVRCLRPAGEISPCFSLETTIGCSIPELNLLYTPRTAGERPDARGPVGVIRAGNPHGSLPPLSHWLTLTRDVGEYADDPNRAEVNDMTPNLMPTLETEVQLRRFHTSRHPLQLAISRNQSLTESVCQFRPVGGEVPGIQLCIAPHPQLALKPLSCTAHRPLNGPSQRHPGKGSKVSGACPAHCINEVPFEG